MACPLIFWVLYMGQLWFEFLSLGPYGCFHARAVECRFLGLICFLFTILYRAVNNRG